MGYHQTFNAITEKLYIRRLAHHLKQYIACCPQCRVNQTARHALYGRIEAIASLALPFHTICMDFILALPISGLDRFNSILTVTDKFSKAKLLIPGRDNMTAKQWASRLLTYLKLCNWRIPKATISDRDAKFRSELWKELFTRLGVDLLVSTVYHPQTDSLSERTNQTVEIALRYLITADSDSLWHESLPALQSNFMNLVVGTTELSPNEVLYGHAMRDEVNILGEKVKHISRKDEQSLCRQEAADAISFANARAKLRYNKTHKHLEFKVGDMVYLRLHHGYTLPDMTNKKLSNQHVGPFEVLQRIGQLAYKLKLPPVMRIHPVVSIAQLEPSEGVNPYHRRRLDHSGPVEIERITLDQAADREPDNSTLPSDSYEVEQILDKRIRRYGRSKPKVEYRVKWLGWGPKWNQWVPEKDCAGSRELISKFEKGQDAA